jgi:hypothetical protein
MPSFADANDGITLGFESAFRDEYKKYEYVRIHCWAHCERNIETKMKELRVSLDARPKLLQDIRRLQICKSKTTFEKACDLFLEKWHENGDSTIDDFLGKFGIIFPIFGKFLPFIGKIFPLFEKIFPFFGNDFYFFGKIFYFFGKIFPFFGNVFNICQ